MTQPIDIKIDSTGAPISMSVRCSNFPQSLAGVVWEYDNNKKPIGVAGEVQPPDGMVPLGAAAAVVNNYYYVDGEVIANPDGPPTPYQIVVSVSQGTQVIHHDVPTGGAGTIDAKDQPYSYVMHLI